MCFTMTSFNGDNCTDNSSCGTLYALQGWEIRQNKKNLNLHVA